MELDDWKMQLSPAKVDYKSFENKDITFQNQMLVNNGFYVYFGMHSVKINKFVGNFHLKLEKFQDCNEFFRLVVMIHSFQYKILAKPLGIFL